MLPIKENWRFATKKDHYEADKSIRAAVSFVGETSHAHAELMERVKSELFM